MDQHVADIQAALRAAIEAPTVTAAIVRLAGARIALDERTGNIDDFNDAYRELWELLETCFNENEQLD